MNFFKKDKARKIVDKYRKKYKSAEEAIDANRKAWNSLEERLEIIFNKVITFQKVDSFYSDLMIQKNNPDFEEIINKGHIALKFGLRTLNIKKIEKDLLTGKPKRFSQELENGGALFFSQGTNGEIFVYLVETKHDEKRNSRKALLLKTYSNPEKINEKNVLKHISQFFWYSLVTSFLSNITWIDKIRIIYYKFRSRTLKIDWSIVIPALILTVAIVHLLLFILYLISL